MNGHTKRQITLFIGVIETKFENPRKGREALFKNLFLFFCWCQNSRRYSEKKTKSTKAVFLGGDAENPPTLLYTCIIFLNRTCAIKKYYARVHCTVKSADFLHCRANFIRKQAETGRCIKVHKKFLCTGAWHYALYRFTLIANKFCPGVQKIRQLYSTRA